MVMIPAETIRMAELEAADRAAASIAKDAVIADLRKALAFVKAERDHWHSLVPGPVRVQCPFDIKGASELPSAKEAP